MTPFAAAPLNPLRAHTNEDDGTDTPDIPAEPETPDQEDLPELPDPTEVGEDG